MNTIIYKYKLSCDYEIQEIKLPKDAEILSITTQYNEVVLYAFVDEDTTKEEKLFDYYRIHIATTGNYAGNFKRENYTFAGTLMLENDRYVIHVFYRKINESELSPIKNMIRTVKI